MKRLIASLALVLTVVFAAGNAHAWSSQGADALSGNANAFEAGVGFPGMKFGYHIPVSKLVTIIPEFTFFYGVGTAVPSVGDGLGVKLKFHLLDKGKLNLAFIAEPMFLLNYHPGVAVGIQIGLPQVVVSYAVNNQFTLFGGLKIPFAFLVHPSFCAIIPIYFNLGVEMSVTPALNLFLAMDMGPSITAASGGSVTTFAPWVQFGMAYKF